MTPTRPRPGARLRLATGLLAIAASAFAPSGCSDPAATPPVWQPVLENMPGALLSVWGTSDHDVYVVGADSRDGRGPTVLHYDGHQWTRLFTSVGSGDLWWINGVGADTVFMTGTNGLILRYTPSTHAFERMSTPTSPVGSATIFGLWGAAPNDVWAAGRINATDTGAVTGIVWHFDGTQWQSVTPPADVDASSDLFKVWGSSAHDVWIVGANATTMHYDGASWARVAVGDDLGGRLITVHGNGTRRFAVGGTGSGVLLEGVDNGWHRVDVQVPALNGLYVPEHGNPVAVGIAGTVLHQDAQQRWHVVNPGPRTDYDFHSLWIAPSGEVWAVGGNITSTPLSNGMLWRFGARLPPATVVDDPAFSACSDTPGTVCTWAGTGAPGFNGDGHSRTTSTLYQPVDLTFAPTAPYRPVIIDWQNHRIRAVLADDTLQTVLGAEIPGDGDPTMMGDHLPPGVPGNTISLNHPTNAIFDPEGQLLVAVWHNHKIRRVNLATGMAYITIGRSSGFAGDGLNVNDTANGDRVLLAKPSHIVWGPAGELYILDQDNARIRRVGTDGVITTCAGTGTAGQPGDGMAAYEGPAMGARFYWQGGESPEPNGGLAVAGNTLFISDTLAHRIRAMDLVTGMLTTYAGTGTAGAAGDGGPALMAQFNNPNDLEIGPEGDLYIADTYNSCVRAIDHTTGVVRTVVGRCGSSGYAGDGGRALQAQLYFPWGIAFDHDGNLYVADTRNSRIRRIHR